MFLNSVMFLFSVNTFAYLVWTLQIVWIHTKLIFHCRFRCAFCGGNWMVFYSDINLPSYSLQTQHLCAVEAVQTGWILRYEASHEITSRDTWQWKARNESPKTRGKRFCFACKPTPIPKRKQCAGFENEQAKRNPKIRASQRNGTHRKNVQSWKSKFGEWNLFR